MNGDRKYTQQNPWGISMRYHSPVEVKSTPVNMDTVTEKWRAAMNRAREAKSWSLLNALGEDGPDPKVDYDSLCSKEMTKDEEILWLRHRVNPWTLMHSIEKGEIPLGIGIPSWATTEDPLGISLMKLRTK